MCSIILSRSTGHHAASSLRLVVAAASIGLVAVAALTLSIVTAGSGSPAAAQVPTDRLGGSNSCTASGHGGPQGTVGRVDHG